jgi:16S rRNA processing protein RimM
LGIDTWDDMVLVGRIARPHGIRGQVIVTPDTDFVDERFHTGATMWCRTPQGDETLTVASMRVQKGRPIVAFAGFATIESVKRLSGCELRVPEASLQPLAEGTYYIHQLVGCVVDTVDGNRVGTVTRVDGGAAGSLLVIDGPRGEVLIPLVAYMCVEIYPEGRRIRVSTTEGLLGLNETRSPGR